MESRTELIDLASVNDMLVDFAEVDEFDDSVNFEELEEELEQELQLQLEDLAFLKEERAKIGSPDNLCETIKGVVWEQFINQIAVTAGTDFIKENRGLTLDLRKSAHFQDSKDFAEGKIATHNTEIDFQKRYDDWQSNFQRDEFGNVKTTYDNRSGKQKETLRVRDVKKDPAGKDYNLNYNARGDFDRNRPVGNDKNHKDHTISAAEIIRDPEANAHLTREEQVKFANSDKNLNDMNSAANQSKGDSTMSEFLDSEKNGKKAAERFDLDEAALRQKDKDAREEYNKVKEEGEKRSNAAGKKSRRQEAFRIGGKALRAVVMQLLAELVKEIISKLIMWFKAAKRTLSMLIESLKAAILSFVSNLKEHMVNAGNTVITTIATAIMKPIVGLIKKVWAMLKQGWKSLKEAINYIRNPENKGKPIDILILEVGKIVIAGLTGIGAMVLGELIEKALCAIPGAGVVFATEIPLLGSLANILGIFLGAVVSGIIGAIAINLIQKKIEGKQKIENNRAQTEIGNRILKTQAELQAVLIEDVNYTEAKVENNIEQRHKMAGNIIVEAVENIKNNINIDATVDDKLSSVSGGLDDLLCEEGI